MPQKIFISYVDADKRYLNKIKRWGKRNKCGDIEIIFSTRDDKGMKTKRGRIIRPKLERKIKEADLVIVLVGGANDAHPWIRYEKFANEQKIVRYFMRIPYTEHPLPDALKSLTQIAYNPNAIEKLFRSENAAAPQAQAPANTSDVAASEGNSDSVEKPKEQAKNKEEDAAATEDTETIENTSDEKSAVVDESTEEKKDEKKAEEDANDETVA